MSSLGYLIKEGLKNVWSNRIMSIASICVLISCLVLTGAAELLSLNVERLVDSVGQTNETTVYLDLEVTNLEAVYIGKDIQKLDNISSIEFYSKDEAIEEYRELLGDELFEDVQGDDNPLPDAFIVVMDDLSLYDDTVTEIQKIDGVDRINNKSEVAQKLTDISNLVNMISIGVVTALMVISLFIIANTIRATMYSRRFEISIMKSVGATDAFVRTPFIVEGVVIGIVSAVLAGGALWLLYDGVIYGVRQVISFSSIPFANTLVYVLPIFLGAGIIIGVLGSFMSMRKYLKKEGNEILGW